jgi:hypothetical protein
MAVTPSAVSVLVKSDVCAERTFHRHKKALVNAGLVPPKARATRSATT